MTESSQPQDKRVSFLARLYRARVIQTLAIYISVGWVLTEIIGAATDTFSLPGWVSGGAVAVLIAGIPVVAFLAWAFQITDQGIATDVKSWKGGLAIALALMLLFGISAFLINSLDKPKPRAVPVSLELPEPVPDLVERASSPSIAVLPFVHLSPGKVDEYLSEGIAEEIRHALSDLEGVRVAARASSNRFRGSNEDIQSIGEQLRVATVLEGSVLQSGDHIRVTVQLIEVTNGFQLWSERYERKMTTIFDIQDSIAKNVVERLKVSNLEAVSTLVSERHPQNVEAYRLYLRGKYHAAMYKEPALRTAINYFREALAAQSDYALAYAGIADAYGSLDYFGHVRPADIARQHRSAVERALDLDPSLAAAHFSFARLLFNREWNAIAAEPEFLRALELDPSDSWKHGLYAIFLSTQGRQKQAMEEALKGQELDPLSLTANLTPGWIHFFGREYREAIAIGKQVAAADPSFVNAQELIAYSQFRLGEREAAITVLERASKVADFPIVLGNLGRMYARVGRTEDATEVLNTLLSRSEYEYIPASTIANVYNGLEEFDEADVWMRKAIANRESNLSILNVVSDDHTRTNPHFADWIATIGLSN